MSTYPDLYEESEPLDGLDVKTSVLPPSVASALIAVQSLGYATLIVYVEDTKSFRFAAISVKEDE